MKKFLIGLISFILLCASGNSYAASYGVGVPTCPACPPCPTVLCPTPPPTFTGVGVVMTVPVATSCPQPQSCPAPKECPSCPPSQTYVIQQSCPSDPYINVSKEPAPQIIPTVPPLSTQAFSRYPDKPIYYSKYDSWTVTTPDYTTEIVYLGLPINPIIVYLSCISGYQYVITEYKGTPINMLQLMNGKDQVPCTTY